jgi:PIN domain nuclease of toxin-antitoxin system
MNIFWKLPISPADLITTSNQAGFEVVITSTHATATSALPPHHQDPFDRLLIAQARLEGLCLLSSDRALKPYGRSVVLLPAWIEGCQ